jgi:sulfate permease, SulP family
MDDASGQSAPLISGSARSGIPKLRSSSFSEYQNLRHMPESTYSPRRSVRFDVTATMDRLRSTLIGGGQQEVAVPFSMTNARSESPDDSGCYIVQNVRDQQQQHSQSSCPTSDTSSQKRFGRNAMSSILSQIPAIVLIGMFHMMIGIPFGVSYFPIGWSSGATANDNEGISGAFPVPGKEALGIRMFLFSTVVGQLTFTAASGFNNPIGLQMVENVPFCHALSHIVIAHQGYGTDALSTLFVMFGLSSVIVGVVFYILGRLELGRVVYYFPTHVLVGCIGGIGIYIAKTGIEVTIDAEFGWSTVTDNVHLLAPVVYFEVLLRILERVTLDADGKPRFSLLSPIYFCMITPVFYVALWLFHFDMKYANEEGYFFPSLLDDCDDDDSCSSTILGSIFNKDLLDMWRVVDLSVVSRPAIVDAIPTLVALTLFSLIHVPINIPAFAISTGAEADMNKELVAHGYSNILAGMFGGLQNYMAYTQSVLYDKSGGRGKASGIAVALVTASLFFIGPTIASYIPRCMAGTLLLHVGIDLFLEGVYDSYGKFDILEYAGIWLITIVMTAYGMNAAMIAGGISAVSTHAVQSVHYVNPIRGAMSASTLRSSRWNRTNEQRAILDDDRVGRSRILVIQLQGHLFFGNMAQLIASINRVLSEQARADAVPWIVILDFSLVLGIDSSAAQTMTKLKNILHKSFKVDLCVFVTGSDAGFPCEFNLSAELKAPSSHRAVPVHDQIVDVEASAKETTPLVGKPNGRVLDAKGKQQFTGSHIEDSLDLALIFAEDALLARQGIFTSLTKVTTSSSDEKEIALHYLTNLCPGEVGNSNIELLFSHFNRELYKKNGILWSQGSSSDCMKLLVQGRLNAMLENEAGTSESVESGNTIGELGLVQGLPRMSSVVCLSDVAVVYNLSRESFEKLCRSAPHAARLVDLMCIRYLSARVQHVSNRIFETRCLPV